MAKTRTPPPIDLKPLPVDTLSGPIPTDQPTRVSLPPSSFDRLPPEEKKEVMDRALDRKSATTPLTPPAVFRQDSGNGSQAVFKTESNQGRFRRATEILEDLFHYAEKTGLHGKIGVEISLQAGVASVTRKILEGTEK